MSKIKNDSQGRKRNSIGILGVSVTILLALLLLTTSSSAATPKIVAGYGHTVAIKSDGTLWTWGYNYWGQLGNNTTTNQNSPVQIAGNNWVAIAANYGHTVALRSDGTLWTWGYNVYGQLGLGDTTDRHSPVQVAGNNWIAIAAGGWHTIALKSDGTLWAWGQNDNGELGLGDTTNRYSPVQVTAAGNNWAAIAAGSHHTIALKSDGTLWAWGYNYQGQLGLGDSGIGTDRNSPVQVTQDLGSNSFTGVASIAAGDVHTLALKSDGSLWAWGSPGNGRLGNGSTSGYVTKPQRIGLDNNWVTISGGSYHSLGLKSDGSLWAWGFNAAGQLGFGPSDLVDRTTPVQVTPAGGNWVEIAGGNGHSAGLKSDGTLWTWGFNTWGQLGNGLPIAVYSPAQITTVDTKWVSTAAGIAHTLAIKSDGTLWAWGYNAYGQLGDNTTTNSLVPKKIGIDTDWVSIAGGEAHTVAIKSDGTLWAWGWNGLGQLGDGTTANKNIPTKIGSVTNWVSIATGADHTVAIKSDGTLWAWGANNYGQLGDGTTNNSNVPMLINPYTIYTINASAGAGGSISPSGAISVNGGSDQTFTFTPDKWFKMQDVLVDNVSQGAITSYPFTNVTSDHTISVSFALDPAPPEPVGWGTTDIAGTSITVNLTYTGPSKYLVPPDCNNIVFNSVPSIPQYCRRIPPYVLTVLEEAETPGLGSPGGDWKLTPTNTSWTINCNLLGIFDEAALKTAGEVQITPMYTFFDTDRALDPVTGICAPGDICVNTSLYPLFRGTIVASEKRVIISSDMVSIDIKPNTFPNTINLKKEGSIPVAIFGTRSFDATSIDVSSLRLAGTAVVLKKKGVYQYSMVDINGDGIIDMVVHFDAKTLGPVTTDSTCVAGQTTSGAPFEGCDFVTIVH
jgi:alpha-tubulin suppressor-like RCC1 family protein